MMKFLIFFSFGFLLIFAGYTLIYYIKKALIKKSSKNSIDPDTHRMAGFRVKGP